MEKLDRASSFTESLKFSYFSIDFSDEEGPQSGFSTVLSCMKSKLRWKASLLNNRNRKITLTEDDVEFLITNTRFSVDDIREWYRQFIMECPAGVLGKEKVKEMLSLLLPVESVQNIANLIFTTFDKDNSGSLNFVEFVTSIHCMSTSSPEDKLRWVFQLYDSDGSGSISMSEMVVLFGCLYQTEGIDKRIAVDRAETLFGNLDINGDGDITEDEFVSACIKDEDMLKILNDSDFDEILSGISTPRD